MLRIIPSILISKKRLVKGIKFDNHKDCGDPIKTCLAYESQNADEISIVDLDSYKREKKEPDFELLEQILNQINTPISLAGNIVNYEVAKKCIKTGVDKILFNTGLLDKDLLEKIASDFGSQCIVASLDIYENNGKYQILTKDKKNFDLSIFKDHFYLDTVGEFKLTFVDREGTKSGFDYNFLTKFTNELKLPFIVEGGIGNLEDILNAASNKIENIALGTALIYSDLNIFKIKSFLKNKNFKVRL